MISVKEFCKSQREQTFHYIGPRLFNISLDKHLAMIPDLPLTTDAVPGLCTYEAIPTNSVIYWTPHLRLYDRRGSHNT